MRKAALRLLVSLLVSFGAAAQTQAPIPPPAPPINASDDPLLRPFRWRAIGPASMGGRIDDIAVVESNPATIYLGLATGGVWKSVNNGTTWDPIFDTYSTASIGDIAVCQQSPDIVWVGTGEPNNRQSSTIGDGIYKSTDGGKTFTHMGLRETQTIARIVIDPNDCNVVYVASPGHLFGPNPERGVYKTTDGGKSWNLVKFVNADTGFTDIAMDPSDSRVLYAASYQRRRAPWGFNGGGPGSGLWRTIDAGRTWAQLSGNGLPAGLLGRIGLDVSRSNPNVVYAQIEVGASSGSGFGPPRGFGAAEPPQRGPAPATAGQAAAGQAAPQQPGSGATAQQPPQPPDPKRSGVWRSDDRGKTWRLMSNNNNRPMYYSQIRVDPTNDQIVYTCGAPFHKSTDGGKTFAIVGGIAHSDHHALWINPHNSNHLLLGNDGGLDCSYDQAKTWEFINTIPAAQFYAVTADMRKPYYVYGGLQDNGSWGGPSATRSSAGITNADWFRIGGGDGFYVQVDPTDPTTIYVESQNGAANRLDLRTGRSTSIRPRAAAARGQRPQAPPTAEPQPETPGVPPPAAPGAPAGTQPADPAQAGSFGSFRGSPTSNIVPAPPPGEQYRFNWSTPIHLSPHNPRTVYLGANKLFRSVDRGETWTASSDLTRQIDRSKLEIMGVAGDQPMVAKNDGTTSYGTITTVAESPVVPGVLWVGTDDGVVQLSRDGGATWANLSDGIPRLKPTHQISRVEPSHFDAATCYVSIDAHRVDDWNPYLVVTRNYGKTWTSIAAGLPRGNVNVVREDPKNKEILYAGTERGMYISLDCGTTWKPFMTGMPSVRVDDIMIHPRDNDLIVGTHGRGVYVLDDITPLQQLNAKVLDAEAHLFDVRPGTRWWTDVTLSRYTGGSKLYRAPNPEPGTAISYFLKNPAAGEVKITITDVGGRVIRTLTGPKEAGLNRVQWNLRHEAPPRAAGLSPGGGGRRSMVERGSAEQPSAAAGATGAAAPGQTSATPAQAGSGGASSAAGFASRFAAFGGAPAEPGTYLVKLSVGGKELQTRVRVEEDNWRNY